MASPAPEVTGLCSDTGLLADDPDVAGPGVLVGFLLASILTLLPSYITLWLHHVRRQRKELAFLNRLSVMEDSPLDFWIDEMEKFVLALSDQQLLTGALLLVVAFYKYYSFSVRCGGNNLWNANDIVAFSSLTHAATLLVLRSYFRRHKALALARVCLMFIIYAMMLVVLVRSLMPDRHVNGRQKLASPISKFWHGVAYIEAIGIFWLYAMTCLPIFISTEATKVRICLAKAAHELEPALDEWKIFLQHQHEVRERRRRSSALHPMGWFDRLKHPYVNLTFFGLWYAETYLKIYQARVTTAIAEKARKRGFLTFMKMGMMWLTAEIVFPWFVTPWVLTIMWLFGLGFICFRIHQTDSIGTWSFGQLLPCFLVLLPLYTLLGTVAEERKPKGEHKLSQTPVVHQATFQRHDPKRALLSRSDTSTTWDTNSPDSPKMPFKPEPVRSASHENSAEMGVIDIGKPVAMRGAQNLYQGV